MRLSSASGVSEVASVGGYIQEYQVDVNPELMRQYNISLHRIVVGSCESKVTRILVPKPWRSIRVEYLVRGLGYIKSVTDIEECRSELRKNYTSLRIKDIAKVTLGPCCQKRHILIKKVLK